LFGVLKTRAQYYWRADRVTSDAALILIQEALSPPKG
jgi:hypothetical protein